jgi:hypothetical protein
METRVAAKLSFLSGGAMFLAPSFRPRASLRGRSVSDNLQIAVSALKHPYCQNVNPTAKRAFRCQPIA